MFGAMAPIRLAAIVVCHLLLIAVIAADGSPEVSESANEKQDPQLEANNLDARAEEALESDSTPGLVITNEDLESGSNDASQSSSIPSDAEADSDTQESSKSVPSEPKGTGPDEQATDQSMSTETTPLTSTIGELETTTASPKIDCLNGGVYRRMEDGSEKCFCKDPFYGRRCQWRNICKSVIADNLTGDQICNRIGRPCIIDDKLFRCECAQNEFFIFKIDHYKIQQQQQQQQKHQRHHQDHSDVSDSSGPMSGDQSPMANKPELTTFAYDAMLALVNQKELSSEGPAASDDTKETQTRSKTTYYLAECRQADRCLGVRCRQISEVCEEGECKCNQNLGYIRDPQDNLCKLLNPCNIPSFEGHHQPVCGQARCLPTYNKELYRCVCPIGYYAVRLGSERSSIQCAVLSNFICLVPLLNKCQHICKIDHERGSYKCSCLPGYRQGSQPGIDDHMCFFEDHLAGSSSSSMYNGTSLDIDDDYDDISDQGDLYANRQVPRIQPRLAFEPVEDEKQTRSADGSNLENPEQTKADRLIRRSIVYEPVPNKRGSEKEPIEDRGEQYNGLGQASERHQFDNEAPGEDDDDDDSLGALSVQERCNMYCDENKICVLDDPITGSYRCVCDRQGYVSVGHKCMDWCRAAEFSHAYGLDLQAGLDLLDLTCVTGLCKPRPGHERWPPSRMGASFYKSSEFLSLEQEEQQLLRLEAKSSWRPSFQCDCSSSKLVYEDTSTHLCKLNFTAILEPCLPGSEGHTECVVNEHAYCAVLHKDPMLHKRSLTIDQVMNQINTAAQSHGPKVKTKAGQAQEAAAAAMKDQAGAKPGTPAVVAANLAGKKTKQEEEKPYVCVCPPEKKLLVDQPRKKKRCVDECGLLNNECGRFNRMCRAATVNSNEHFGYKSTLVREDQDGGVRMNQFKRTGCECLPGFNVGPSEPRDFTLDTNYPEEDGGGDPSSSNGSAATSGATGTKPADSPPGSSSPTSNGSQQRPRRFGWDAIEDFLLQGTPFMVNNPPRTDKSVIQRELLGIGQEIEHLRTRYMNINSRCLLDYDVVEFHARFKAPTDFEPAWVMTGRATKQPVSGGGVAGSGSGRPPDATSQPQEQLAKPTTNSGDASSPPSDPPLDGDSKQHHQEPDGRRATPDNVILDQVPAEELNSRLLKVPEFMRVDMSEFYKHIVLVADCTFLVSQKSFQAYEQCIRYRYWIVQKFRAHFADWRQVMTKSLRETFDLMDGNIRFRVNKCEPIIKQVTSVPKAYTESLATTTGTSSAGAAAPAVVSAVLSTETEVSHYDPWDQYARVDADLDCKLTIHSASDYDSSGSRRQAKRVLLEKQLPKFIFEHFLSDQQKDSAGAAASAAGSFTSSAGSSSKGGLTSNGKPQYYLMAPNALIHHHSIDESAAHRKAFSPCNSEYSYCDKQTFCEMLDAPKYSCTCQAGYTPIGSRDISFGDSRKEVCEDINECLFDVCSGSQLENKSTCVNEIGDYKCKCNSHYIGDNKRYCNHICNVLNCKHGDCRIFEDHHARCECFEGYREADCSVQDPSVALRKANVIICSSIFASVLLLAITLAISLNSQLKKTKRELKRLEAAQEAVEFYEFSLQQPPYRHRVSKASIAS